MLHRARPLGLGQHRRQSGRFGSVILIVVVALVCLMGAAAMTVDVGMVLMVSSRAQSVADACALAGAAGVIVGQTSAVTARVQEMLDANNTGPMPATWTPSELVTYSGGQTVPGYGAIGSTDEAVKVRVRITASYTFARVIGLDSQVIERSATALRQVSSAGGAMFLSLDSTSGNTGIDISGSAANFKGLIHSNNRVVITGSAHHFWDWVEWVSRFTTGSGYTWDKGNRASVVNADPMASLTPDSFAPFDYVINGNYSMTGSNKTVPPGVYRVYGNVSISGSSQTANNVTFVADGEIGATGSAFKYTANRMGMFAYTTSSDQTGAIAVSGSAASCVGGLYAPNGDIDFSGSANAFIKTSVIGWKIGVTGSTYTVEPTPSFGPQTASVRLIN